MKRLLVSILLIAAVQANAQKIPPTYSGEGGSEGFKQENIFIGGGMNLGFAANTFGVGINPEIGYSFSQWLDAGFAFNVGYTSQAADPYYNGNLRIRSFDYGAGPFVRLYPVPFLFATIQPEINWTKANYKDYNNGSSYSYSIHATSLIAGLGYSQRMVGQSNYFLMIGVDLLNELNSPYNIYGSKMPIIKGGFDLYLRPSRKK